ncbi:MAG: 1,4-alpha-glucan branching enzyme, partial [Clostridia bacterium]|nr:1,4-alpha-glucan branching enzyme [Clostridia bacterium]
MGNAKPIKCDAAAGQADPIPWDFCAGARAYEFFGVHRTPTGVVFRVWAPHADEVTVCGDFNAWSICANPLRRLGNGIWEATVAGDCVREGQVYKYWIRNGRWSGFKADPYGFGTQRPPETGSVICDIGAYSWRDGAWMRYRRDRFTRQGAARQPINVYELHVGSWRRHEDGSPYTYGELASELIPYVKQMGYTHVELMPLAEHPFDGSWGYQVGGYYAPTSRYGSPLELMALVDGFHEAGIGVILDWVPGHFCKNDHGLADFDGQPLYEYASVERMEHPVWGTRLFDLERREVQAFLVSNALFWAEVYHVDGLRVDAVSSMLYDGGEERPSARVCVAAVEFLKLLNRTLERELPDVMTVAEESSGWPGVTGFAGGGLGFTMTWGMG